MKTLLIVDDDLSVLEVLEARLFSAGFQVLKSVGAKDALNILKVQNVDLMISDMKMPGMGGMDLFAAVRVEYPDLPVIFLTAYGTISDAVKAVKSGAVDYLTKPFDGHELIKKINDILARVPGAVEEIDTPVRPVFSKGKSSSMKKLYGLIEKVAKSNVNVLILGDSGVGKEHVAREIYQSGPRKNEPFIVVDCGSTPSGLLESELFGHVKGAFTHAIRDKKGLIEAADKGTLFLDEVGNISQEMQVRLLRFLEDRKIRRIGDIKEIPVDCRIIAATNTDLIKDMKSGRFREDLYYRLRVVTLTIPLLRERKKDIPVLAQHFVETFCKSNKLPMVTLPDETTEWLCEYPWPGNVRELKNALEAGIVLCRGRVLYPSDLYLIGLPEERLILSESSAGDNPFSLEESERQTIIRALKESGGVQKGAAELLGISRRAINYKIKKYNIN